MPWQAQRNLTALGVKYRAGSMIPNGVIPPRMEEGLKSRGQILYVEPGQIKKAEPATVEPVAPTPTDTAPRKRGRPPGSKNTKKK